MQDLRLIDPNFALPAVKTEGIVFHDVRKADVDIYGLFSPREGTAFCRMPRSVAESVRPGVVTLNGHTSGGRIRFRTDSGRIVLRVRQSGVRIHYGHMTFLNAAGFDLYLYQDGVQRYWDSFVPPVDRTDGYEAMVTFPDRQMRDIVLNMPSYDDVLSLYIGLDEGAALTGGSRYLLDQPVVYYGSSITQGGCASRPGNIYQNILSRRLNIDYVNLGFSGNAKGDLPVAEYMASVDAAAYVVDYDHNAPTAEYLEATHEPFVRTIRNKRPDTPILLVSRPGIPRTDAERETVNRYRQVIVRTFETLKAEGDGNILFLDGQTMFARRGGDSCTVDRNHPNDLGFLAMADAMEPFLRNMLHMEA